MVKFGICGFLAPFQKNVEASPRNFSRSAEKNHFFCSRLIEILYLCSRKRINNDDYGSEENKRTGS